MAIECRYVPLLFANPKYRFSRVLVQLLNNRLFQSTFIRLDLVNVAEKTIPQNIDP